MSPSASADRRHSAPIRAEVSPAGMESHLFISFGAGRDAAPLRSYKAGSSGNVSSTSTRSLGRNLPVWTSFSSERLDLPP